MNEILSSRTRYSAEELTLVDWEGAVIVAPKADYRSDIALLKIGNYQLLRYRMLDQSIEEMLDKISETFFQNKRRLRPTRGMIRQIAEHRLEVMLGAERAEQTGEYVGSVKRFSELMATRKFEKCRLTGGARALAGISLRPRPPSDTYRAAATPIEMTDMRSSDGSDRSGD